MRNKAECSNTFGPDCSYVFTLNVRVDNLTYVRFPKTTI